ncbi:MAG: Rpn family recombination-promoting nuclease/putative transposase [Methanobrevibacter sp. CfCl-M3]
MASEGMERQLKSFINAVLKENNDSIEFIEIIENKLIFAEIKGQKNCILDLRSVASDGRHFIVEVQRQNQYHFKKRSLLYLAREYSNSAKKGELEDLNPHILINILDFNFCKDDLPNQKFNIVGKTNECLYSDHLTIYNINIPAFRKLKEKDLNNPLHRWIIFFDKKSPKRLINEVTEMDEDIKAADEKFNELLSDEKAFHDYQMRQLAKMELESEINHSRKEGKIEGIKEGIIKGEQKGRNEGKLEVAINLLSKGMELDLVSEITNIPISKLKSLKH